MIIKSNTAKEIEVTDKAFAVDYNESLVHQVIVSEFSNRRSGTKAQKIDLQSQVAVRSLGNKKGQAEQEPGLQDQIFGLVAVGHLLHNHKITQKN